jgi:hypothetical protein
MFKDIDIFWLAAQSILQGRDPYSIPNLEVFYPLPFYFLFIPLVGLPLGVVHAVWTAVQAVILIAVLRRRAIYVALSMPVLLTFILGQVDIVMTGLFVLLRSGDGGGIALAFLVLKPQLVFLLAPWMLWQWWQHDRRQIVWFIVVCGSLVILSFFVQPDWVAHLYARSGERARAGISASLWGLLAYLPSSIWLPVTAIIVAIIAVWAWRKNDFSIVTTVGLLTSPFVFSYNLLPQLTLIRKPVFLIGFTILSWVVFAISAWQMNERAAVLLSFLTLAFLLFTSRSVSPNCAERGEPG